MRRGKIIEAMIDAQEERLDDDTHPILETIYGSKIQTIEAIYNEETTPNVVDRNCHEALLKDIDLPTYVRVQAARNTAAWARGELDRL